MRIISISDIRVWLQDFIEISNKADNEFINFLYVYHCTYLKFSFLEFIMSV